MPLVPGDRVVRGRGEQGPEDRQGQGGGHREPGPELRPCHIHAVLAFLLGPDRRSSENNPRHPIPGEKSRRIAGPSDLRDSPGPNGRKFRKNRSRLPRFFRGTARPDGVGLALRSPSRGFHPLAVRAVPRDREFFRWEPLDRRRTDLYSAGLASSAISSPRLVRPNAENSRGTARDSGLVSHARSCGREAGRSHPRGIPA